MHNIDKDSESVRERERNVRVRKIGANLPFVFHFDFVYNRSQLIPRTTDSSFVLTYVRGTISSTIFLSEPTLASKIIHPLRGRIYIKSNIADPIDTYVLCTLCTALKLYRDTTWYVNETTHKTSTYDFRYDNCSVDANYPN